MHVGDLHRRLPYRSHRSSKRGNLQFQHRSALRLQSRGQPEHISVAIDYILSTVLRASLVAGCCRIYLLDESGKQRGCMSSRSCSTCCDRLHGLEKKTSDASRHRVVDTQECPCGIFVVRWERRDDAVQTPASSATWKRGGRGGSQCSGDDFLKFSQSAAGCSRRQPLSKRCRHAHSHRQHR